MKSYNQIREQAWQMIQEAEKKYDFKLIDKIGRIRNTYKENISAYLKTDLNCDHIACIKPISREIYTNKYLKILKPIL